MSSVSLPRWVVGLLVGACAVSVAGVAFLAGRVTAPAPATAPATVAAPGAAPLGVEAADPVATASVPEAYAAPSTEPPIAGDASGQGLVSDPSPAAELATGSGPEAAGVADYFRQMDAIAAEVKTSQDPQALARSILDQAMSGNTGAIESLIATQRSLEARLGQIVPPPACREHHQRSVRIFGRAITLLERTRDAMTRPGASDLGSVAAEGRAIETEARALDALANDLRRAAGLPPVP